MKRRNQWLRGTWVLRLIVLACATVGGPTADADVLASVQVTGAVADPAGVPIEGATVSVEVVASLSPDELHEETRFTLGPHRVVLTDATGAYAADMDIPDGFPEHHLYARIVAMLLPTSAPQGRYGKATGMIPLAPIEAGKVYSHDAILPNRASEGWQVGFVKGTIRDGETKELLRGMPIDVSQHIYGTQPSDDDRLIWTDADGGYVGSVLWDSFDGQLITLCAPSGSFTRRSTSSGISYTTDCESRTPVPGSLHLIDLELAPVRAEGRITILGRLTDAARGAPIPNALVVLTEFVLNHEDGGTMSRVESASLTDRFGRYQLPARLCCSSDLLEPTSLKLSTNGAYRELTDSEAPYEGQEIELLGQLTRGEVFQQNFSLSPRPNAPAGIEPPSGVEWSKY